MSNHPSGIRLHQTTPAGLLRYAEAVVKNALNEFKGQSEEQTRWYGRTRRILIITEPKSAAAEFLQAVLEEEHIAVEFMSVYNRDDLNRVVAAVAEGRYQVLVPTNLELSPFYIPEFVSAVKNTSPSVKIAVISGYAESEFVDDLRRRGIDDFIGVPPKTDDLQRRIFGLLPGY